MKIIGLMHIPKLFEIKDRNLIEKFIKETGLATLISKGSNYPIATHIPLELEVNENGKQVLMGHIAKSNPQWVDFEKEENVLAIFLSPLNSYISSSWYNHPNVPTWNYLSVQISGKIKIIAGDKLWESLRRLTERHEQQSENPIVLDAMPEEVKKQVNGIVGFEISIEKVEAAFKLSQNRNEEDFENILKQLRQSNDKIAHLMAEVMEQERKRGV